MLTLEQCNSCGSWNLIYKLGEDTYTCSDCNAVGSFSRDDKLMINNLIYYGERISNSIVFKVEKEMYVEAIESIDEIIDNLNVVKEYLKLKGDTYEK